MKTFLFYFFALGIAVLGGCTAKGTIAPLPSTYDDDFTFDGGSYHNTDIQFKKVDNSSCDKAPSGTTYTEVKVNGSSDTITVVSWEVRFNATTTGTYNCDKNNNTFVVIKITTKNNPTPVEYDSEDGNCSINCTDYGAVGAKVKGKFSGKFISNGTTYTVVNATFSVTRTS